MSLKVTELEAYLNTLFCDKMLSALEDAEVSFTDTEIREIVSLALDYALLSNDSAHRLHGRQ